MMTLHFFKAAIFTNVPSGSVHAYFDAATKTKFVFVKKRNVIILTFFIGDWDTAWLPPPPLSEPPLLREEVQKPGAEVVDWISPCAPVAGYR